MSFSIKDGIDITNVSMHDENDGIVITYPVKKLFSTKTKTETVFIEDLQTICAFEDKCRDIIVKLTTEYNTIFQKKQENKLNDIKENLANIYSILSQNEIFSNNTTYKNLGKIIKQQSKGGKRRNRKSKKIRKSRNNRRKSQRRSRR